MRCSISRCFGDCMAVRNRSYFVQRVCCARLAGDRSMFDSLIIRLNRRISISRISNCRLVESLPQKSAERERPQRKAFLAGAVPGGNDGQLFSSKKNTASFQRNCCMKIVLAAHGKKRGQKPWERRARPRNPHQHWVWAVGNGACGCRGHAIKMQTYIFRQRLCTHNSPRAATTA